MSQIKVLFAVSALTVAMSGAIAEGSGHTNSISPGTGSKLSSEHVNGYTKKDGTYVAPYEKSTPDRSFNNNWSTKGNENLVTGKEGTRINAPTRK